MSKSRVTEYDDAMSDTEVPRFSSPAAASAAGSINELDGPTIYDGSPEAYLAIPPEDRYIPIGYHQIGDIIGKILTLTEMIGLPAEQQKAVKSVFRQTIHNWYVEATENAETSYRRCLGPIVAVRDARGKERKFVWTAGGPDEELGYAVSVGQQ